MKTVTAIAALVALAAFGAMAQAKVSPLQSQASVLGVDDATGRSAAQREADYFRATQQSAQSSRVGERLPPPCRLQHVIFEKARLAESCR